MNAFFIEDFAPAFAVEWIAAWNARDLDRILKHYAQDIEFASPLVSRLLPDHHENILRGIVLLRVYFSRALNAYPDLRFLTRRVYSGVQSLVIEYESVANLVAAETMEFNEAALVCRVRAHYTALAANSKDSR